MKKSFTVLALLMSLSALAANDLGGTLEFLSEVGAGKKIDDKTFVACGLDKSKSEITNKDRLPRSPAVIERFGRKLNTGFHEAFPSRTFSRILHRGH